MLKDMLSFETMITPKVIKVLYWIGIVAVILTGLGAIIGGLNSYNGGAIVFSGVLTVLIGPIVVRIYCELMILLFNIYEKLCDIAKSA